MDDKVPEGAPLEGPGISLAADPFANSVLSPSEFMFGCSDIMYMINIVLKCLSAENSNIMVMKTKRRREDKMNGQREARHFLVVGRHKKGQ